MRCASCWCACVGGGDSELEQINIDDDGGARDGGDGGAVDTRAPVRVSFVRSSAPPPLSSYPHLGDRGFASLKHVLLPGLLAAAHDLKLAPRALEGERVGCRRLFSRLLARPRRLERHFFLSDHLEGSKSFGGTAIYGWLWWCLIGGPIDRSMRWRSIWMAFLCSARVEQGRKYDL